MKNNQNSHAFGAFTEVEQKLFKNYKLISFNIENFDNIELFFP
jgi:hypothetical protein